MPSRRIPLGRTVAADGSESRNDGALLTPLTPKNDMSTMIQNRTEQLIRLFKYLYSDWIENHIAFRAESRGSHRSHRHYRRPTPVPAVIAARRVVPP